MRARRSDNPGFYAPISVGYAQPSLTFTHLYAQYDYLNRMAKSG